MFIISSSSTYFKMTYNFHVPLLKIGRENKQKIIDIFTLLKIYIILIHKKMKNHFTTCPHDTLYSNS